VVSKGNWCTNQLATNGCIAHMLAGSWQWH